MHKLVDPEEIMNILNSDPNKLMQYRRMKIKGSMLNSIIVNK